MPSKSRTSQRRAGKPKAAPARRPTKKAPPPKKAPAKPSRALPSKSTSKVAAKPSNGPLVAPAPPLEVPLPGGRHHVLSLSFVRDGDEFMARLETDSGHITELKNRALDQLLTLVAGELEDLLE
jgi:hypothetical protein